jgi:hypothetical protein
VRATKSGYIAELTEQEGRDLYQFMATKKVMGYMDIECPEDALGVLIAVAGERKIHGAKGKKNHESSERAKQ